MTGMANPRQRPMRGIRRWPFSTPSRTPDKSRDTNTFADGEALVDQLRLGGLETRGDPPARASCAISCSCGRQATACCRRSPPVGPRRAKTRWCSRPRSRPPLPTRPWCPGQKDRCSEPGPLGGTARHAGPRLDGPAAIGRPFTAQGMPWLHAPVPRPRGAGPGAGGAPWPAAETAPRRAAFATGAVRRADPIHGMCVHVGSGLRRLRFSGGHVA
jgi:hypothetical protein